MRARWLCLAALAAVVPARAGCGGVGVSGASENDRQPAGDLLEPAAAGTRRRRSPQEIVNGERLALSQAGGHIGPLKVGYVSLDDANPKTGELDPGATSTDAKTAAQDTSTIAYLGEYGSEATAVSLPLINAAGILQVSPGSPYIGLDVLAGRRPGRARALLSRAANATSGACSSATARRRSRRPS